MYALCRRKRLPLQPSQHPERMPAPLDWQTLHHAGPHLAPPHLASFYCGRPRSLLTQQID